MYVRGFCTLAEDSDRHQVNIHITSLRHLADSGELTCTSQLANFADGVRYGRMIDQEDLHAFDQRRLLSKRRQQLIDLS